MPTSPRSKTPGKASPCRGLRPKWEETYKCGCVAGAPRKRELLGYCAKHGTDREGIPWNNEENQVVDGVTYAAHNPTIRSARKIYLGHLFRRLAQGPD